jgi:hypothetical protein
MKHFYMLLIGLFIGISSVSAQFEVAVGKQPFMVYLYNNDFYVLCKGVDANFDGIYDPQTDELPSLWRNNPIGMGPLSAYKLIDFPFGLNSFPVRPHFDGDLLYIQTNGYIWKYNIANGILLDSIEFQSVVYGLSVYDDVLYVTTRVTPPGSWTPENNYIIRINLQTKLPIDTIDAKMNVQMCKVQNNMLYVLNEGFGGENESFVTVYDINTKEEVKAFNAGAMGNFFEIKDDYIYVVSNGSHKVYKYSLTSEESFVYEVGTSGWDGPRELVFNPEGNKFRVSAYDGKIYEFKLNNATPVNIIDATKKVEGMLWTNYFDNDVFIASLINNQDYSANDYVLVWVNPISSVADIVKKIAVYPNPASNYVIINNSENYFDNYELVSLDGKILLDGVLNSFENKINLASVNSGSYLLRLSGSNQNIAIVVRVEK